MHVSEQFYSDYVNINRVINCTVMACFVVSNAQIVSMTGRSFCFVFSGGGGSRFESSQCLL
jgi:hypothetical protein